MNKYDYHPATESTPLVSTAVRDHNLLDLSKPADLLYNFRCMVKWAGADIFTMTPILERRDMSFWMLPAPTASVSGKLHLRPKRFLLWRG
jgi:hypothetical protein